jgi:hypothetical protein
MEGRNNRIKGSMWGYKYLLTAFEFDHGIEK